MKAYIVAGGTGGHINSALAIGLRLEQEGHQVCYLSGKRKLDLQLFEGKNVIHLDAKPLSGKSPLTIMKNIFANLRVFFKVFNLFKNERPDFVFGAGGYVCGPTLGSAYFLKIPVYILEQNSVFGLTNKLLQGLATKIFTHFEETKGLKEEFSAKVRVSGNPLRDSFYRSKTSANRVEGVTKVLIFGGSLGAKAINEFAEKWLSLTRDNKLEVTHQTGGKIGEAPLEIAANVQYNRLNYIENMAQELFNADFVICRGGASTVAELRLVKRPVLIIPLMIHRDKHQWVNAKALQQEAEFPVFVEPSLEKLAAENFRELEEMIEKSKSYKGTESLDEKHDQATEMIVEEIKTDVL